MSTVNANQVAQKYLIPRFIDNDFKYALLAIDEILIGILTGTFGILIHQIIAGIIFAFLIVVKYKKVKREKGANYLSNLAYWYLPNVVVYKTTPPSYMRHFLG